MNIFTACFVVDCGGGLAYDVINTVGQAFEIRFKLFLQNPPLATEVPERYMCKILDIIIGCSNSKYIIRVVLVTFFFQPDLCRLKINFMIGHPQTPLS